MLVPSAELTLAIGKLSNVHIPSLAPAGPDSAAIDTAAASAAILLAIVIPLCFSRYQSA